VRAARQRKPPVRQMGLLPGRGEKNSVFLRLSHSKSCATRALPKEPQPKTSRVLFTPQALMNCSSVQGGVFEPVSNPADQGPTWASSDSPLKILLSLYNHPPPPHTPYLYHPPPLHTPLHTPGPT
jgi:hypothetical protein